MPETVTSLAASPVPVVESLIPPPAEMDSSCSSTNVVMESRTVPETVNASPDSISTAPPAAWTVPATAIAPPSVVSVTAPFAAWTVPPLLTSIAPAPVVATDTPSSSDWTMP